MSPKTLIAAGLAAAALITGAVLWLLPGEDPRALAPGHWQEAGRILRAQVGADGHIRWQFGGREGKLQYEWEDTEHEPYRLTLIRGERRISALLTFEDDDTAILEPDILSELSPRQRRELAQMNRANRRPEHEIRFLFRRLREPEKR